MTTETARIRIELDPVLNPMQFAPGADHDHRPQRQADAPASPYGSDWNGWKAIAAVAIVAILALAAYGMSGNIADATKFGKVNEMTASLYKDEQAQMTARNANNNVALVEVAKANATATAAMQTGPLVVNVSAPARVTNVRGGGVNLVPGNAAHGTGNNCTMPDGRAGKDYNGLGCIAPRR